MHLIQCEKYSIVFKPGPNRENVWRYHLFYLVYRYKYRYNCRFN